MAGETGHREKDSALAGGMCEYRDIKVLGCVRGQGTELWLMGCLEYSEKSFGCWAVRVQRTKHCYWLVTGLSECNGQSIGYWLVTGLSEYNGQCFGYWAVKVQGTTFWLLSCNSTRNQTLVSGMSEYKGQSSGCWEIRIQGEKKTLVVGMS